MPDKLHWHFQWIGIGVYLAALLIVSMCWRSFALQPLWMVWGICTVLWFFGLTYWFFRRWSNNDTKTFRRKVFWWALGIRTVYVGAIIFYYYLQTGLSMEYEVADSYGYHQMACYLSNLARQGHFRDILPILNANTLGYSDQGYILYLTTLYTCFGKNILGPRLLKALMSAYMCVAIYKLASRNLGEKTARLAAVMAVFLPQFIHYNGTYMKETEMVFLATMALERMDYLIHSKRYTFWNIFVPIVFTILTFGFRTILGMILIASFVFDVIMCEHSLLSRKTRVVAASVAVLVTMAISFTPIGREMWAMLRINFLTAEVTVEKYQEMGLQYAEYAQGKYFAPGFFTLPLTNLVEIANPNQKMMNGTYFVKNYLAFFAMWCIIVSIREKKGRKLGLIGPFAILYSLIITFSFAFNSERYHFPVMPCLLIMSAFAMTHFRRRDFKYYYAYCILLLVAIVFWNYIKLAGRGLV